jgi:hypothetical protein
MFNPLDPRLFTDPHPMLDALREHDPVYFEPALNMWVVTGHDEAMHVMRARGGDHRYVEFQRLRVQGEVESQPYLRGMREWILMKDAADHKRIRGVFTRHFTKRRVEDLRPRLATTAHALIDGFAADGHTELVEAFAKPLPLDIIGELMAVPVADQARIAHMIEAFKIAVQPLPMTDEQLRTANDGLTGLDAYFSSLIAQRRADPGDDLLTVLIREADAGEMTPAELVTNAWGLYAAGHETSGSAICNGVWLLSRNPAQLGLLREDWSRADQAVDEVLRMDGPGQATVRLFPDALEVGGHVIPADTPVMVYFLAASRDPRHWSCPHEFAVDREHIRDHFGFGQGIHRCLGAHLARVTMSVALEAIFTRLPGIAVEELRWNQHSIFHGPSRMTVSWPSRAGGRR